MPLYEYRCKSCKHQFEKIQKFSDDPIRVCPECGLEAVEQLLSAPAFQFKGSGWYVNDYGHKNVPPAGSANGNGESKGAADSASAASVPPSKPAPSVAAESK